MSHELLYTSAPSGLKPGQHGFCTVAASAALPRNLWDRLEALSGYRHGEGNPVVRAHWLVSVGGGREVSVLSRVCDAGLDYTGRTNYFAHHLAIDPDERNSAGPAWMLARPDLLQTSWNGQVGTLPGRARLPSGTVSPGICLRWQQAAGDAGWAGVLADAAFRNPRKPVAILLPADLDPLPLIAEAVALLPVERRWDVSFSTYFTGLPSNTTCSWRCCLAGTPAAAEAIRHASGSLVINLAQPQRLGPAPAGPWTDFARQGGASPAAGAPASAPRPTVFTRGKTPIRQSAAVESDEELPADQQPENGPSEGDAAWAIRPSPGRVIVSDADEHRPVDARWMEPRKQARRRAVLAGVAAALLLVAAGTWLSMVARRSASLPETVQIPPADPVVSTAPATSKPATSPSVLEPDPLLNVGPTVVRPIDPIAPPPVDSTSQPATPAVATPQITPNLPPPPTPRFAMSSPPDPRLGVSSGIRDPIQTISIPPEAQAGAAQSTTLRLTFPKQARSYVSRHPDLSGELKIEPRGGRKEALIWRDATGSSSLEVATFSVELSRPNNSLAMDVSWKTATLTRRPEVTALARLLTQLGDATLVDAAGKALLTLTFPDPEPISIDLTSPQAAVSQQVPPTATPNIRPGSIDGWTASYKPATGGQPSVIAFERPADSDLPAQRVEIRVAVGWRSVESDWAERRETSRASAAEAATRLATADQELVRVIEGGKNKLAPLQGEVNEAASQLKLPDDELRSRGTNRPLAKVRLENARAALQSAKGPVDQEIEQAKMTRLKAEMYSRAAAASHQAYDRFRDATIELALPDGTRAGTLRLSAPQ